MQDIFLWWLAIYSYYSPPLVSANDAAGRGGNKQSTRRWTQTRPVKKESLFIYRTACLKIEKNIWHEICSPKMRDYNNDLCAQTHILCLQAVWFCQSQVGPWSLKSHCHNHSTPHTTLLGYASTGKQFSQWFFNVFVTTQPMLVMVFHFWTIEINGFYRNQVYVGSDLWVQVSLRPSVSDVLLT